MFGNWLCRRVLAGDVVLVTRQEGSRATGHAVHAKVVIVVANL